MAVDVIETELDGVLSFTPGTKSSTEAVCNVRILQHFQAFTSLTIGGDLCRGVMHAFATQSAWKNSHFIHMALAVSAAHLKRLHLNASQLRLYQQFAVAEAGHWQTGLQLYQEELQATEHDFDSTVGTMFLTVIFTFSLDDDIPLDAYSSQDDDKFKHAINPVAAAGGFRVLRDVLGDYMFDSIWKPILMTADDDHGTFSYSGQPGIDGLPTAFVQLCDLDAGSTSENNEYHVIVHLLAPLLRLEPSIENFTKVVSFAGRSWPQLRPLLLRKDPRGFLFLSYWFALLGQVNQWWLVHRAKSECLAIVHYLSQLQDAKISALLPYPASFGEADLSYIWERLEPDSAAIFERYFQNAISRPSLHLRETLSSRRP